LNNIFSNLIIADQHDLLSWSSLYIIRQQNIYAVKYVSSMKTLCVPYFSLIVFQLKSLLKNGGFVEAKEGNARDSKADNITASSTGKWSDEVFYKEFEKEAACQREAVDHMKKKVPVTHFKS
jgi:hypothetical protein